MEIRVMLLIEQTTDNQTHRARRVHGKQHRKQIQHLLLAVILDPLDLLPDFLFRLTHLT